MTYDQFVEIINMPAVLAILFFVVFGVGYGALSLLAWLRHR